MQRRGSLYGLAAAALFGASAPLAKLLLPSFSPLVLAGLLYFGAGIALSLFRLVSGGMRGRRRQREAALRRQDWPLLAGIMVVGGIFGPVLMLVGLGHLSALAASLLLNLEAPFTILLALVLFREYLGRGQLISIALVLLGAGLLAYRPGELRAEWPGVLALAGACLCWALDNNWTQRLSTRDPTALVQVKTLGAGGATLIIALLAGQPFPGPSSVGTALLLGSVSYGLSIVLDAYALRLLGAAREAAFFATAPFVGAAIAIPLLQERPSWSDGLAALLMLAGVALLVRERHWHVHTHEALEHDHIHVHDEHHQHEHEGSVTEPHSHPHRHDPMTHSHAHVSDVHHRHRH